MTDIEIYDNYLATQKKHPTALVFQDNNGFHEVYGKNAIIFANICNVKLTTKSFGEIKNVPTCGFVFGSDIDVSKEKDFFDKIVIIHSDGIKTILRLK